MLPSFRETLVAAMSWPPALAEYARRGWSQRFAARDGAIHMANEPSGPPDLDEIFRKFNQKLASLFGQDKGSQPAGDGGGPSGGMPAGAVSGAFLVAGGILFSVWLATGFYIVEEGSKGVELRLGRYTQTTEAGPRWHWPYPIETVEVVNVQQVRAIEVGHRNNQRNKMKEEALMLTKDQNIVEVMFSVQYSLKKPEEYKFNNKNPDEAVQQVAETAMRQEVGNRKMDDVLYESRGAIAASVRDLMQKILDDYKTGIQIISVNMQNAQPPEQVQASFNDAVRAKQDRERLKNEGEAYANDIVPKAKGRAAALLEEASAHKQSVIATAQGDVARFSQLLTEYEKAPGVTRERLYLETMQQVLQNTSKVVVDQKGGSSLLYLPLDKLIAGQPAAAPAAPVVEAPRPTPAETTVITPDTRRDLRNR